MARPETAQHLRSLLADYAPYRERWRAHMRRATKDAIHQGAVAWVIAAHLWDTGQVAESTTDLPRRLRDRISRALSGEVLTVETLTWFIDSFEMVEAHSARLWRHFRNDAVAGGGPAGPAVVSPPSPADEPAGAAERMPVNRDAYSVHTLDEYHLLGPDGIPVLHQTFQVIRAMRSLERYSMQLDTALTSVEIVRGGRRGPTYPHPRHPGVSVVDIVFPKVLQPGETIALEFRLTFHYASPPAPEFRRSFTAVVPSVTMQVRFDPASRPARVWWSQWPSLESEPTRSEPVELESDASAYRFVENMPASLVGFRWEWQ